MAAVTKVKPRFVSPVGYEEIDVCELLEDVEAGDLLQFTGDMSDGQAVMQLVPANATEQVDGVALQTGFAGQRGFDFGIVFEMDGFSGLAPGDLVYADAAVAGGLNTTANGDPVGKCVRGTRIRFHLM